VAIAFFFEDLHHHKLVSTDFFEGDPDAELQCRAHVLRAPHQNSGLAVLRIIDPDERAVVTPLSLRRIVAELRIAEFVAPERPVHQIADRGMIRPLAR
jgi:hypothetical protein